MSKALERDIKAESVRLSMVNTKISRRSFVKAGVGGAIAAGVGAKVAHGSGYGGGTRRPRRGDPLLFLVNRITQGFSQPLYDRVKTRGYHSFLEEQLNPDAIDDSALDAVLEQYPSLSMSYGELYDNYTRQGLDYIVYYELKFANLL